jgi:transcriptional regulator of met regulon
MVDKSTNQVITRERINGKIGQNKLKIYTSSLPVKYLYLILEDNTRTQIGKTSIIIN